MWLERAIMKRRYIYLKLIMFLLVNMFLFYVLYSRIRSETYHVWELLQIASVEALAIYAAFIRKDKQLDDEE